MYSNNRRELIIGMMLEDISSDFSKELVRSVVNSITANRNIRLAVLPGKYDDGIGWVHEYRAIHNSIFMLREQISLDGMIIHLGSIYNEEEHLLYESFMERNNDIPKVFIGLDDPELTSVNYDNESGISEAIDYLVNIVGLTRLCMLGGRADNKDASIRKNIFINCLEKNGLSYSEKQFVNTDMSTVCFAEAEKLLDNNPDTQAVFCVNDAAAKALYKVMGDRGLVPGKDIMVFGFDNTNMSGELIPSLSSIGSDGISLGQKALELLLSKISGEKVSSELVHTRLYGRESLPYEMYDYNTLEMIHIESSFIYRMFDDCFYRFKTAPRDREMIDLRRLFFEFISRMLLAMKRRYMSIETYDEIRRLIDIFFDNGAMRYTDSAKLLKSVDKLQTQMNLAQRSVFAREKTNRLFLQIKDKAILALATELSTERKDIIEKQRNLQFFTAESMGFDRSQGEVFERILKSIGRLGSDNCAFYMYDEPFVYSAEAPEQYPNFIRLVCVIRDGNVQILPEARQRCRLSDIFSKNELPSNGKGFIAFTVFHRNLIYGLLLCEPVDAIYSIGEYISLQLGRALYLNDIKSPSVLWKKDKS